MSIERREPHLNAPLRGASAERKPPERKPSEPAGFDRLTDVVTITVEVRGPRGGGSVVVRDPAGPAPRVFVLGDLEQSRATALVRRLGLAALPPEAATELPGVSSRRGPVVADAGTLVGAGDSPNARLATQLDELVAIVLRAGRGGPTNTVDEALGDLRRGAPRAPLLRALSFLQQGLEPQGCAAQAGLALVCLSYLAEQLRDEGSAVSEELLPRATTTPLPACLLVELARRRERHERSWETRLLLDLGSGHLLREEGETLPSGGTCGRQLEVVLGTRYAGLEPQRVCVQQYEHEPSAPIAALTRILELAQPTIAALPARASHSSALPRLVAFPAPQLLRVGHCDAALRTLELSGGERLPLDDGATPGVSQLLIERSPAPGSAVAGTLEVRATAAGAQLVLVPWSVVCAGAAPTLVSLTY